LEVNPKNCQAREALPPDPFAYGARLGRSLENMQDPIVIEQVWSMQMLGNLGQNETYILYFLPLLPVQKRFHATAASKHFQVNALPV